MPEIRLGSAENFPNINLGGIELQEIWLGSVLVWQNNQGPIFASIVWDGNTFSVPGFSTTDPDVGDWSFTPANATFAGQVDGGAGSGADETRNITLVINNILDPDNVDPEADDFIVGFRLQRPDGSWVYGDPESTANNADGSPIADYGTTLPGTSSTYDAANDEFTAGSETDATSSITVPIRAVDGTGTIVTTTAQEFADDGEWKLYVVDSRGGESAEGIIDVTLNYQAPNGFVRNQSGSGVGFNAEISTNANSPTSYTNATIGGGSTATFNVANIGGPLAATGTYAWESRVGGGAWTAAGTGAISNALNIPQANAGNATPRQVRVTLLGREWNGNAGQTFTTNVGYFRSGAACLPGYNAVGDSSFSFFSDSGGNTAVCNPLVTAPTSPTISCSGDCSGFSWSSGTSYSRPFPGCPSGTATPNTATVSISGTTGGIALTASGSRGFSGSLGGVSSTCTVTVSSTGGAGLAQTVYNVASSCSGTTCDGPPAVPNSCSGSFTAVINEPNNYRVTSGESFSGCSAGGSTTATISIGNIIGTAGVVCPATTVVGSTTACTINTSTNGVDVQSSSAVANNVVCSAAGTITVTGSGTTMYTNGTADFTPSSATTTCVTAPHSPPTFDTATCTFSCATGTVTGGSATIPAGTTASRTCTGGAMSASTATTGTCPMALTNTQVVYDFPNPGSGCMAGEIGSIMVSAAADPAGAGYTTFVSCGSSVTFCVNPGFSFLNGISFGAPPSGAFGSAFFTDNAC